MPIRQLDNMLLNATCPGTLILQHTVACTDKCMHRTVFNPLLSAFSCQADTFFAILLKVM